MAAFTYNTTSITIQEPRFPYSKGARSLIINHNTRDGQRVTGSITGLNTHITLLSPRFALTNDDWDKLYDFITNTIGAGLHKFKYTDGQVPDDHHYSVVYLSGIQNPQMVRENRHELTLQLEGTLEED